MAGTAVTPNTPAHPQPKHASININTVPVPSEQVTQQ